MTASRSSRAGRLAGGALAAALLLTACGDDSGTAGSAQDEPSPSESTSESSEPTETPSETPTETPTDSGEVPEPTSPACGDVWVAGQALPKRYSGCFDAEKERWVQAMVYRCSSGQQLVTYRRTFYAAKGEKVNETDGPLARDPEFTKAMASCGA